MGDRVLVVDDEAGVRDILKQLLDYEGYEVKVVSSGGAALTAYPEFRPKVVILDVKMAHMDGLDTLTRLRDLDPGVVAVMISGHATITTALDATRRGAFDFMEKPLDSNRLIVTVRNAIAHAELAGENRRLRQETVVRYQMVGNSPAMQQLRETIERVGPTNGRVLITGENGSGKELVARAIHDHSPRRKAPFIELNCAAIPDELIESELFGHVKGSFTGAVSDRPGKFEQADGGTLFLDEVGDMSPSVQAKVLRALQEGVITPVGGSKAIQVDARVIAATNRNLEDEILAGRFRQDLFYRLNVVPIHVPPLRERREDIEPLVEYFVEQLSGGAGTRGKRFEPGAIQRLATRQWPGNVRELKNAVERILILTPSRRITGEEVKRLLGGTFGALVPEAEVSGEQTLDEYMLDAERHYIVSTMLDHEENVAEVARVLGLTRQALYRRLVALGLQTKGKKEKGA